MTCPRPRPLRLGRFFAPASRNNPGSGWLCRHCWHPRDGHHTNGRCYTLTDIAARMAWWDRTGLWPSPEESCTPLPPATRACCLGGHLDETRTGWRCAVCERFYPVGREPWRGKEER
jgi:hypothetical protein